MARKRKMHVIYAGIDVSKDKLDVSWLGLDGAVHAFEVANDAGGHIDLVSRFQSPRVSEVRVVFEATGPYSTALGRFLCGQPSRIKAMMLQPAAARQFARATGRRAKTDRVDADLLRQYAERMEFVPTALPSERTAGTRAVARHMAALIDRGAALKNERHAAVAAGTTHPAVLRVIDRELDHLTMLVDELEATIMEELRADPKVNHAIDRLVEIQGIKQRSVSRLVPELIALPQHLSPREVVAYAGLDPKPRQSGTSVGRHGSWAISKQGNARIRRSLYLAALTAIRHFPPARAVYEHLRARGKLKKVAIVAVMRKMLTAIWCMISRDQPFDTAKFTGLPLAKAA